VREWENKRQATSTTLLTETYRFHFHLSVISYAQVCTYCWSQKVNNTATLEDASIVAQKCNHKPLVHTVTSKINVIQPTPIFYQLSTCTTTPLVSPTAKQVLEQETVQSCLLKYSLSQYAHVLIMNRFDSMCSLSMLNNKFLDTMRIYTIRHCALLLTAARNVGVKEHF